MGKYTPPPVTFRDVLAALPPVQAPLAWTVYLREAPGSPLYAYACVGLGVAGTKGYSREWRRWGRQANTKSPAAMMTAFLLAAQEAHNSVAQIAPDELRRLVCWDTDTPRT